MRRVSINVDGRSVQWNDQIVAWSIDCSLPLGQPVSPLRSRKNSIVRPHRKCATTETDNISQYQHLFPGISRASDIRHQTSDIIRENEIEMKKFPLAVRHSTWSFDADVMCMWKNISRHCTETESGTEKVSKNRTELKSPETHRLRVVTQSFWRVAS